MTDLNNNPEVWTNPEKIDVSRKANKYTLFSVGMHNCLGSKTVNIAQPVLIREVSYAVLLHKTRVFTDC